MKITTFNPMILTSIENSENIIMLFEELGFERRHEVDNVDNRGINSVVTSKPHNPCRQTVG